MSETKNSSLLVKIAVLVVICFFVLPAQAKYNGGTGEPNDPYLINTAEQMNAIGTDSNDWDKHFKLMADIDLSGFTGTSFNIIGYYVSYNDPNNRPFTGVFDGGGHKISNFTYDSNGVNGIGLFGYVNDPNAEIKNLGLIDPNVDAGTGNYVGSLVGNLSGGTVIVCYAKGGNVSGTSYVGGLTGYKNGKIYNCYSQGSVSGNRCVGGLVGRGGGLSNCYAKGSVSGITSVGGLVGSGGNISNCYAKGSVSGNRGVGGLVGSGGGLSNCNATGSVSGNDGVGGLVGSGSSILDCYASGNVTGKGYYVGGLAGYCESGTINNCYSSGSVSGDWYVGGLVGYIYEAGITNCNAIVKVSGKYYVGGLVGDTYWGSITNCRATASVSGTTNVGGLVGDTHHGKISNCYSDGDVSGSQSVGGLLGTTSPGGIWNCYSTSSVSGVECVGGLVGWHHGSIINSYATGSVAGIRPVGGLVGYSPGAVYNSFWDIRTSGQETSDGGTGLPTSEMLIMSTFTDAGWDFVGETANGTEDIWWIREGLDYPRLWYETLVPAEARIIPRTINLASKDKWMTCYIRLPEDYNVTDIDPNSVFLEDEIQPEQFQVDEHSQVATARFNAEELIAILNIGQVEITIAGRLTDWTIFEGTDTIKIIDNKKIIDNSYKRNVHRLIAHWKFDDGSGSVAIDSAKNNDGTLMGDPNWTTGIIDGALSFDGEGDYVAVKSIDALAGDTFTIQAWIRVDAYAGPYNPILTQNDLNNNGCYFYVTNGRPSFCIFDGAGFVQAVSPETINADQWYHVAATNDGSNLNLYVNSMLKASASSVGLTGVDYDAYIGCEITSHLYYNGLIDDVRIYDRALSEDEIAVLAD